ncbi:MAG: MBOAT family protein [Oscillospiraceae bacterium]|nr:MBOAT family protein [Oscillospiraceae bacterium]
MLFSSPSFLYYFLPIALILYFITPMPKGSPRLRNVTLLVMSLVFYAWGEPRYVFLMIAQCVFAWGFGLLIDKHRGQKAAKTLMLISVVISLSGLIYFKYANFFISNVNNLTNSNIAFIRFVMPIGISFYTFQLLSYTIDLYRGLIRVSRNVLDFSTYVASFPQLIAGPIVRYSDIEAALSKREHSFSRFAMGSRRFIIGLGKKMLIANMFGELVAIYKVSGDESVLFVWLYLIAYTMQIYFDFSGYSDMAIGLGHIFGFKFPENFNYPYIADSITNFWRRWHMTLSGWFRDYVYIPLGGNRVKVLRHVFNIMLVWMLTGFWHGADWNFILWGGYFGVVLLVEKLFLGKALRKAPKAVRHIYVILIVFISWAFFDALGFNEAFTVIGRMFGAGGTLASREALYYLRSYAVPLVIAVIGSTPLIMKLAQKIDTKKRLVVVLEPVVLLLILIVSTASMVDGSFNPFIYFRF